MTSLWRVPSSQWIRTMHINLVLLWFMDIRCRLEDRAEVKHSTPHILNSLISPMENHSIYTVKGNLNCCYKKAEMAKQISTT